MGEMLLSFMKASMELGGRQAKNEEIIERSFLTEDMILM